jgi:serine/threonine-protein kinase
MDRLVEPAPPAAACPRCGAAHDEAAACAHEAPARAAADRTGEVVGGKYQISRLLGEGGMGVVYEAKHTFVGRRFAIKFLRPEFARDLDMLARFQREAQAAGTLEAENIAAVTDFGVDGAGAPYLVMEHLDGEDLARLLARNGRMAVSRAAGLMVQACRGLAVAHAHGLVHRDLKPGNLFVLRRADGGDLVKVIDFGIAKLRSTADDAPSRTKTGAMMGTPYYMPPEQARGQRDIDHRADVYALGAILYELLSGAKPHPGDSYNAILFNILTQPAAPLSSLRPGLPPGLGAVVERAMAFEPGDRFASADELAQALLPFARPPVVAGGPAELALPGAGAADTRAATLSTPTTAAGAPRAPGRGDDVPSSGAAGRTASTSVGVDQEPPTSRPARHRTRSALLVAAAVVAGGGLWAWRAHVAPRAADPPVAAARATGDRGDRGAAAPPAAQERAAPPPPPTPSPAATITTTPPAPAPPAPAPPPAPAARHAHDDARPAAKHARRKRAAAKTAADAIEFDARNPYGN